MFANWTKNDKGDGSWKLIKIKTRISIYLWSCLLCNNFAELKRRSCFLYFGKFLEQNEEIPYICDCACSVITLFPLGKFFEQNAASSFWLGTTQTFVHDSAPDWKPGKKFPPWQSGATLLTNTIPNTKIQIQIQMIKKTLLSLQMVGPNFCRYQLSKALADDHRGARLN